MRSCPWGAIRCGLALLALPAPAYAADPTAAVVWYRGSAECPAGTEFLQMLGERAKMARLAGAGDHIDFIVTLVATPAETVGRLERQTQTGTVAIRELRDANCKHVADAIALSLGLSLEPGHEAPPSENSAPKTTTESEAHPAPPEVAPEITAPLNAPTAPGPTLQPSTTEAPSATRQHRPRWSVGAHGGVLIGVSPSPMGLAAAFVDLDGALADLAPALSFRFGVVGAFGSAETEVGPVSRSILGGFVEACPFRAGGETWAVRPCLALEIGATGASSSRETSVNGSSLWTAPGAKLRGTLDVLRPVALEAELAGLIPLPRHDVAAGADTLYRDSAVLFQAGLGLSVRVQ